MCHLDRISWRLVAVIAPSQQFRKASVNTSSDLLEQRCACQSETRILLLKTKNYMNSRPCAIFVCLLRQRLHTWLQIMLFILPESPFCFQVHLCMHVSEDETWPYFADKISKVNSLRFEHQIHLRLGQYALLWRTQPISKEDLVLEVIIEELQVAFDIAENLLLWRH